MSSKKSSGDYDGWIFRLIDRIEELRFSFDLQKWLDFAECKILDSEYAPVSGKLTEAQKDALSERRGDIYELAPTRLNITPEYVTRYRGVGTGRWAVKTPHGYKDGKTGRFVKAKPESAERYRNLGGYGQGVGTMVSAKEINAELRRLKGKE